MRVCTSGLRVEVRDQKAVATGDAHTPLELRSLDLEPRSDSPTVDSDSARQLSDSPTVPTVRQSDSPRQLSDSVRQCFLWHHDRPLSDGPTVRPTVPTVPTVSIFSDSSDSFQQFQECRPCQQPWTHKNQRRCVNNFAKMSRISRTTHHCCGFRLAALKTCS